MNLSDETLKIETPENVAFGLSVSGIGSRFLAALVDTSLIVIMQVLVILIPIIFLNMNHVLDLEKISAWMYALLTLLSFVFLWGYYIFFELAWNGQTPGKRLFGLRVVRKDGMPVTLTEVLIRNLVRIVDFLPSSYGVGVVTMFLDAQSRRLGDMAGGTLVVHDRGAVSLASLSAEKPAIAMGERTQATLAGFPVERLTNDDFHLVEEYVQRRSLLPNRGVLAGQILRKLCERVRVDFGSLDREYDLMLMAIAASIASRAKIESGEKL